MKSSKLPQGHLRLARPSAGRSQHPRQVPADQVLVCSPTAFTRRFILDDSFSYAGSASSSADSSSTQLDVFGSQGYPLDRSQTPRPSDYARTPSYSSVLAPPSAPPFAPPPAAPLAAPVQPPAPLYSPVSPPTSTVPNEDEPIAAAPGDLQRAVSLFRTPTLLRHDDHGEQLPAFTEVARPEEMVAEGMPHTGPTPPLPSTQSPPPPHTFSPPLSPPPPVNNPPSPLVNNPPPPPVHNVSPPPPPPVHSAPLPPPPPPFFANVPASPIHSDPPPAFVPSNDHGAIPEKTNPYAHLHLQNARVMSRPMSVYASANRTYAPPTIKLDPEAVYGRRASPGLPNETALSFYR
jgi:hypothetical protein